MVVKSFVDEFRLNGFVGLCLKVDLQVVALFEVVQSDFLLFGSVWFAD